MMKNVLRMMMIMSSNDNDVMKKVVRMMMMMMMIMSFNDNDEDIYQRLCLHTRRTAQTCSQMRLSGPSLGLSSVHPSVAPASDCVVVPTQKTKFLQLP